MFCFFNVSSMYALRFIFWCFSKTLQIKQQFFRYTQYSNVLQRTTSSSLPLLDTSSGSRIRTSSSGHAIIDAAANFKGRPKYCLHVSLDKWPVLLLYLHHTSNGGNYHLICGTGSKRIFPEFLALEINNDLLSMNVVYSLLMDNINYRLSANGQISVTCH